MLIGEFVEWVKENKVTEKVLSNKLSKFTKAEIITIFIKLITHYKSLVLTPAEEKEIVIEQQKKADEHKKFMLENFVKPGDQDFDEQWND